MSLTVASVVNRMRDLHPALSPANAPLGLAYRQLSELERRMADAISVRVPGFLAQELTVTFPLASFSAGIDLDTAIPGGWVDLLPGKVQYNSTPEIGWQPCSYVPYQQVDLPVSPPTYTLRDNTLYFLGAESQYANVSRFVLPYTPHPAALTAPTSALILPDGALEYLAQGLAAFYLGRMVGQPQFGVTGDTAKYHLSLAGAAEAAYKATAFRVTQRQHYVMRDVGPRM